MTKLKPGLGRGLDALINPQIRDNEDGPITISSTDIKNDDGKSYNVLAKIPLQLIDPNPFQPRVAFDPKTLDELKKSILENGLIQPVTVRRGRENRYELISGERRLRACKDIGLRDIPGYIIKVDTKEAMLALSLIENIQRERLNPIEVALAYKRLLNECNLSQEEIAEKVGKDRTTITNSIRLLKLPQELQNSLVENVISAGHARALINLPDKSIQLKMMAKIKKEGLSVRKVEKMVQDYLKQGSGAIKRNKGKTSLTDASIVSQMDLEDKLRQIFGTKVMCKQKKDGSGEIVIEYYSNDELERLFELFTIIGKTYN